MLIFVSQKSPWLANDYLRVKIETIHAKKLLSSANRASSAATALYSIVSTDSGPEKVN